MTREQEVAAGICPQSVWEFPGPARFQIAPPALPAYSNGLMGQQHRVKVKRKRRTAYLERKRVAAKAPRRPAAKARGKKAAAAAPAPAAAESPAA